MSISVYYKPAVAIGGQLASKTISSNGVYNAGAEGVYGFSQVTVAVPSAVLVSQIFSQNGSYAPSDFGAEGFSDITVSVEDTGKALIEGTLSGVLSRDDITKVGAYAFAYNNNITEVSFPNCSYVGSNAFQNCSALSSISFPNCLSIASNAFQNCSALSSISFPNCLSIDQYAFNNCSALTTASFSNCLYIGGAAFSNCTKLSKAYFLNNMVANIQLGTFYNTPMSNSTYLGYFGSIYVRASLLTEYQVAPNWSQYSARLVGLTDEEIAQLDNE